MHDLVSLPPVRARDVSLFGRAVPLTSRGRRAALSFAQRLLSADTMSQRFARFWPDWQPDIEAFVRQDQSSDPIAAQQAVSNELCDWVWQLCRAEHDIADDSAANRDDSADAEAIYADDGSGLDAEDEYGEANDAPAELAIIGAAGCGKSYVIVTALQTLLAKGLRAAPPGVRALGVSGNYDLAAAAPTHKACSELSKRLATAGLGDKVGVFTTRQVLQRLSWGADYISAAQWLALWESPRNADADATPPDTESHARTARRAELTRSLCFSFLDHIAGLPDQRMAEAARICVENGADPAFHYLGVDPFKIFTPFWSPRDEVFATVILVDETTMLAEADYHASRHCARGFALLGDVLQLPPIADERTRQDFDVEPPSALSRVAWDDVRVLRHNFRAAAGALHFALADFVVGSGRTFAEVETLALALARMSEHIVPTTAFDASLVPYAPILTWRNANRLRHAIGWRDALGLPRAALVPGEPLLLTRVVDNVRDRYQGRLAKNLLVRAGVSGGGMTRLVLPDGSVTGPLPVWVGANNLNDLRKAGIPLTGAETWGGVVLQQGAYAVMAEPGGAITTHRSQGSEWSVVQIDWADIRAFAYSPYGARTSEQLPGLTAWQRLLYVQLTRAVHQVRLVGLAGAASGWTGRPGRLHADLPGEALQLLQGAA
jgi:AAA domain